MKRVGIFLVLMSLTGCEIINGIIGNNSLPEVRSVSPSEGDTNVSVSADVNAALDLPNGGVDLTSVSERGARLTNTATGAVVEANASVDNDAQTLTLDPVSELEFSTDYRFTVTSALVDVSGRAFTEYSSTFTTISGDTPFVLASAPADGDTDVPVTTGVRATEINLIKGVDVGTLTEESVYLENVDTNERVAIRINTSGGSDTITLQPRQPLLPLTEYQFNVTSAVRDLNGEAFLPYTANFTTGSGDEGISTDIRLTEQPTTAGVRHSSLAFDPNDNYLYATTILGEIKRYPVAPDGTLGNPETITSLRRHEGGKDRLTVGLAFDPASTEGNPIVWVTHTFIDPSKFDGSVEAGINQYWSGKLTRLSGPNLETVQDVVVGLPRSNKDHVTNSIAFHKTEPGVLYFVQGSNTAMGAPDKAWGPQGERALSGAVLRLDTNLLTSELEPLDVKTEEGGTYDPFADGAPLTVYASGTRNSYDLVWHSNGNLYVPANGSAAGGVIPRYNPVNDVCQNRIDGRPYTGPILDSVDDVSTDAYTTVNGTDGWLVAKQILDDYLFKIEEGGYYGTPNPKRCEWILNGGGIGFPGYPTTDVELYPDSVGYDPNYRGPAGTFGQNISPNGAIEYKGSAFSNLKGKLLVVRYALGDDIVAVTLGSDGNAAGGLTTPIVRSGSFSDPIDIAEDPRTGYLYVSTYDQTGGEAAKEAGITLLRPRSQ